MGVKKQDLLENEEIQDFIGGTPSTLLRWGMVVMAFFVLILLVGSYFFHYPDTLSGKLVVLPSADTSKVLGKLYLSPVNVGEVKSGLLVRGYIENFSSSRYGILKGKVSRVNGVPTAEGWYEIEVLFPEMKTDRGFVLPRYMQLSGTGKVVLKERRLLEIMLEPMFKLLN